MILSKDSCFLKRTLVAKVKKQEPGCWEQHGKVSSGWILLILQKERRAKPPNDLSEQGKIWRCDWELGGNSRSQYKLHWFQLHQKGINLVQGQILGVFSGFYCFSLMSLQTPCISDVFSLNLEGLLRNLLFLFSCRIQFIFLLFIFVPFHLGLTELNDDWFFLWQVGTWQLLLCFCKSRMAWIKWAWQTPHLLAVQRSDLLYYDVLPTIVWVKTDSNRTVSNLQSIVNFNIWANGFMKTTWYVKWY